MEIRCSWCTALMGYKDGPDMTTHGICPDCAEAEKAKLDRAMIRKYNAGVVDMIEDLMMFAPIPKARV
jgi:ribosome modulation factor